jgi:hypothetical protein
MAFRAALGRPSLKKGDVQATAAAVQRTASFMKQKQTETSTIGGRAATIASPRGLEESDKMAQTIILGGEGEEASTVMKDETGAQQDHQQQLEALTQLQEEPCERQQHSIQW